MRQNEPEDPTDKVIDVAEPAGVSRQTVSRVLADHPRVAATTKRRVEDVIAELAYRPNRMARALVTQKSLTFGIASADMRNSHFAETCSGMQAVARQRGYHLVITELDLDDDSGIGTLERLLTLGVDGIVIFPNIVDDADLEAFAARCARPVVMIGRAKRIPNVISIALDEAGAARIIVDRLLAIGKRHIGLLMNEMFPGVPHERYTALQRAIELALGDDSAPVEASRPMIEDSKAAAIRLMTAHPEVDAIVAFNDTVAMGALAACRELGLRVPEDVSLIGYDGIPYGAASKPPLTTMLQDSFEMAGAAIEALLASSENGRPPSGEVLLWEPQLLIRGTA